MAKPPAFQFYPRDHLGDTRALHPISRGLWWDCVCYMWFQDPRGIITGTIEQLERMLSSCNADVTFFIGEIKALNVANVTESNGIVTIVNRRMFREDEARRGANARVAKHRKNKGKKQQGNENETGLSSSTSSGVKKIKAFSPPRNKKETKVKGMRDAQEALTEIKSLIKFKEWDPKKSIYCLVFNHERMSGDPVLEKLLQQDPCPNDNYKRQEWFNRFGGQYEKLRGEMYGEEE